MSANDGLPPLRTVINTYGLAARKSLGQNFILDLNLTGKIARLGGDLSRKTVVEIGPGPGGLTRALLYHGAKHVIVVETDQRCIPALRDIADHYPCRLDIIQADALNMDYRALGLSNAVIIANLPYGIATPLLMMWVQDHEWPGWFDRLILMFQREVAERIVSPPGSKSYGRLSVMVQARMHARLSFKIPASAFTPQPKIESAIVDLSIRFPELTPFSVATLERVTAAAFGQRRKMLRTSLKSLLDNPEESLAVLGIEPTLRAEDLPVELFCKIARFIDR